MICKECERLNTVNETLHAALGTPQPGIEQDLKFQLEACREELANLKVAFAKLHEDRDRLVILNELDQIRKEVETT
jgi:hypothetical protein